MELTGIDPAEAMANRTPSVGQLMSSLRNDLFAERVSLLIC